MKKVKKIERDQADTSNVLAHTGDALAEALTGLAAGDRKDWALSIGHLFQRIRGGAFLHQLKEEWEFYREKGRIDDEYIHTEQHQACLQQLLDFLDHDSPDAVRFSALKKIFLTAATSEAKMHDSVLPHEYMKICRSLSTGEVLLLEATHRVATGGETFQVKMATLKWRHKVSDVSGLKFVELVELHEKALVSKRLIMEPALTDGNMAKLGSHFRLTDLGFDICEFIASAPCEFSGAV